MSFSASILLAAVTVGTWNGQWFPSGRAEHRAPAAVEERTIQEAGKILRKGLDALDPMGTNDVVICLNEMRGPKAAQSLCDAIGRDGLKLVVITAYRRRDRFDMQQDAILTTLPVVTANWAKWKNAKADTPPRGYAKAKLVFPGAVTTAVYSVHLKSNYGQTTEQMAQLNRRKRALAIEQLTQQEKPPRGKKKPSSVIIAGDLNADKWAEEFKEETIFEVLAKACFSTVLELLPPDKRITYPRRGKWGSTALDYIFYRSLKPLGQPVIISAQGVSDHDAVFVNFSTEL